MAQFNLVIDLVLDLEGGFQNNPADWGNYNAYDDDGNLVPYRERKGRTLQSGTNRGISTALFSTLLKRVVTEEEIRSISVSMARDIYKVVFWDNIKGDHISDQRIANLIFDTHVNHGSYGKKMVQVVLNNLGFNLVVDGIIGTKTLTAINSAMVADLHDGILDIRILKYRELAEKREDNDRFLNGWLNRLKKFPRMKVGSDEYQISKAQVVQPSSYALPAVALILAVAYFFDE
ncbi:MAG: glycosyl hydrolase 108 family protein [Bacteroidota bacterium]